MSRRGHLDNPDAQNRLRARDKERERKDAEGLREVVATVQGRRFVWRLMDEVAGLHSGTFAGTNETFWREGRRSVGRDVMVEVQRAAPEHYVAMVTEAMARAKEDELHRRDAGQRAAQQETDE